MKSIFKKMDHFLNNSFFIFSLFLGIQIFIFSRWFYLQETFDYHIDGFAILGAPWSSLWDVFHVLPVMKLDRMGQYFWGHFAWVLFGMNSVAISFFMVWVHAANSTLLMILIKNVGLKKIAFPVALLFCINPVSTWETPFLYLAPDSFGVFFAFLTMIAFFSKQKYSWLFTLFFYFWAASTKETFLIATPLNIFFLYFVKNSEEKSDKLFSMIINFFKLYQNKIIIISLIALTIIISYIPIYKNSMNTGAGYEAGGFYSLGYNPFDIFYTIGWHISNLSINYSSENLFSKISKNGFIIIGFLFFLISIIGIIFSKRKSFFALILCFIIGLGPVLLLPIFQSPQNRYSYFASSFLFFAYFLTLDFIFKLLNRKKIVNANYFRLLSILLVLGLTFLSRHSVGFSYITKYYSDFSKIRRNQIVDLKARIPKINEGSHFFIYGLEENTVTNSLRACHGISVVYKMPVGCNFDYEAGFKDSLKNAKGEYYVLKYSKDMNYIEDLQIFGTKK